MSKRETLLEILRKIKPGVNFEEAHGILENGYLDSLEFVTMIQEIGSNLGVDIDADDITPENFDTLDSIEKLVERSGR